jgi:predicted secreted protein
MTPASITTGSARGDQWGEPIRLAGQRSVDQGTAAQEARNDRVTTAFHSPFASGSSIVPSCTGFHSAASLATRNIGRDGAARITKQVIMRQ